MSPNGDGVADRLSLTYKVVRPSTVTVQLRGPDGALRVNTNAALAGHVSVPVERPSRRRTPEQEGTWSFTVGATDDLGRTSSVERVFTLDLTLGTPATVTPALTVPRLRPRAVATFALTRQAR